MKFLQKGDFAMKQERELKLFQNLNFILDKLNNDKLLGFLKHSIDGIFEKEFSFAINEINKLNRKKKRKFSLGEQLIKNTHIFKENFKVICNLMIDQIWKTQVAKYDS